MDKFKIINRAMQDGQSYTRLQLTKLVGFNVTRRTIDNLIQRGCINEQKGQYGTTQADIFTVSEAPKALRTRDFEIVHEGRENFSVINGSEASASID